MKGMENWRAKRVSQAEISAETDADRVSLAGSADAVLWSNSDGDTRFCFTYVKINETQEQTIVD